MKFKIIHLFFLFLFTFWCLGSITLAQPKDKYSKLVLEAGSSLEKGIKFFHSLTTEGGYVYHYSLDLKEKWGEIANGKIDEHTIEVQPPGTPSVGMAFLRAYRLTKNPAFLHAAYGAADALIRGQNELGGWEHQIHFNRPPGKKVSFDDNQTQSVISFLMALDQEIDRPELTKSIEKALGMMLQSQMEHGGWPHQYPEQGNYHDFATFNDQGINDCIRVMVEAHRFYQKEAYLESLYKVGRFLMISQLPPPQPGWAQQYNDYLQPSWARSFEPPSVCPLVTIYNINSLIDLYLHTRRSEYLEPIPDALSYLSNSRLPNGKWGRFLELGTNKPLYYDRGRIRVNSLEELSLERRTGYRYEVDLEKELSMAKERFNTVQSLQPKTFPAQLHAETTPEAKTPRLDELALQVKDLIAAQDASGRWISLQDQFRDYTPTQKWKGEYRVEDRISTALFIRNVDILCEFLEAYHELD